SHPISSRPMLARGSIRTIWKPTRQNRLVGPCTPISQPSSPSMPSNALAKKSVPLSWRRSARPRILRASLASLPLTITVTRTGLIWWVGRSKTGNSSTPRVSAQPCNVSKVGSTYGVRNAKCGTPMTALEVLSQQVINGFTTGSYLALIALGYTMVYGLIELINFAHGDIYALGFFFSLTLFTWLGVPRTLVAALPASTLVWMLPGVMLLTMVGTGLVNVSLDRLAYKPLRRAPRIAALITAVGASFALENIMQNWYGPSQILYPNVFPDINLAKLTLGPSTSILLSTKDLFLFGFTMPML